MTQYLVRWLPEGGGKGVIVGDWNEIIKASEMFMKAGATKIEIETIHTNQPPKKGTKSDEDGNEQRTNQNHTGRIAAASP